MRTFRILASTLAFAGALHAGAALHTFRAALDGAQETPPVATAGTGDAYVTLDDVTRLVRWSVKYSGLSGPVTLAHFHGPAAPGVSAAPAVTMPHGPSPMRGSATFTVQQASDLLAGLHYINLHTSLHGGGEVRGQVLATPVPAPHDFSADRRPDLVWTNTANGATYVWRMNGLVVDSDFHVGTVDRTWELIAVGDANGDGATDVAWRNLVNGAIYVWFIDENGAFLGDTEMPSFAGYRPEAVADFDADGRPDILHRSGSGLAALVYGEGSGPFDFFDIPAEWRVVGAGDFDGDGIADLLFRHETSGLAFIWHVHHDAAGATLGTSTPPLFQIDPMWEVVQVADWNADGSPDLVFRNPASGVVFVWYVVGEALAGSDFIVQIDPSWEIVPRR